MESEQPSQARIGVALVSEKDFLPGGLVIVDQKLIPAGQVWRRVIHVPGRLRGERECHGEPCGMILTSRARAGGEDGDGPIARFLIHSWRDKNKLGSMTNGTWAS